MTDEARLHRIADAHETQYGKEWRFEVTEGALVGDGGKALVFEVAHQGFGFGKHEYRQTRLDLLARQPPPPFSFNQPQRIG